MVNAYGEGQAIAHQLLQHQNAICRKWMYYPQSGQIGHYRVLAKLGFLKRLVRPTLMTSPPWNRYELADNAELRARVILVKILQIINEKDPTKIDYRGPCNYLTCYPNGRI